MQEREPHDITWDNVSDKLVEFLPELRHAYEKELETWDDRKAPPHVVYGDILMPYIVAKCKERDEKAISRALQLVEVLASHSDVLVQEIVGATILEDLLAESRILKRVKPFMGPTTLEFLQSKERYWLRGSVMNDLRSFWRGIRRLFRK